MKKWYILLFSILLLLGFVACGKNSASGMAADSQAADKASYQTITQEKAKELMDTQEVLILDVREQNEYDSGHIPNAVLLPVGQIDEKNSRAGHSCKGCSGAGLLPQWKPQQNGGQLAGGAGVYPDL